MPDGMPVTCTLSVPDGWLHATSKRASRPSAQMGVSSLRTDGCMLDSFDASGV